MSSFTGLGPHQHIRLVAPSRWTTEEAVSRIEALIRSWGYVPERGEHLLARDGQVAGTDVQRTQDFIAAWDDPQVGAIWAMRGGYGAQRIVDSLAEQISFESPKLFIGFSDSSAIHGMLTRKGMLSLHGPLASTYDSTEPDDQRAFINCLQGDFPDIVFNSHPLNKAGQASGRLVGGNLSVLQTMIGTPSFPAQQGDILFIEDLDEMLYHLDRMLVHLLRAGVFEGLSAVIVGSFDAMRDNTKAYGFSVDNPYGATALDIISERLSHLKIPVAFGFPAGHGKRNYPLLLGAEVELTLAASGPCVLRVC